MELRINVLDKRAHYMDAPTDIICGNSDYTIRFSFDEEWAGIDEKTARFIWDGTYADRPIVDGVCEAPVLHNTSRVQVGVYGGNLHTTSPAVIFCQKSILCSDPTINPEDGKDYEEACKKNAEEAKAAADEATTASSEATAAAEAAKAAAKEVADALGDGTGIRVIPGHALYYDEGGKLSVQVAGEPEPDNTLPITAAAVHTSVGNIEILLKTI